LSRFRRIRTKLAVAFAVPLVVLVAVAALGAISSISQVNSVDRQSALATTSVGPGGVVQALQNEREEAILSVLSAATGLPAGLRGITPATAGLGGPAASIELATDQSIAQFESSVERAGSQAKSDYQNAIATIKEYLVPARRLWQGLGHGSVSDPQRLETDVFRSYTSMVGILIGAASTVPLQVSDPTLRTGVEVLNASLDKAEADWAVVQDLIVAAWSPPGAALAQAADQATQDFGAEQALAQRLADLASGPYANAVNTLSSSTVGESLQTEGVLMVQQGTTPLLPAILGAFTDSAPGIPNTGAGPASSQALQPGNLVAVGDRAIAAVVAKRAAQLHNAAVAKAEELGAATLAAALLGLVLLVLVSRSISQPLAQLARQAEKLASEDLPAAVQSILQGNEVTYAPPVDVAGGDEVAEVARALDAVQRTALELAGGQASLRRNLAQAFVNLGRRNQNLVTRQLEYISEIELKEADPESLEDLFRLDHLATRMRRNAESLLILAGSGPARPWSAPVAAMDVVRAASAEVEDYQRLRLHHFDHALVTGPATTDLVHILAELMENALQFSPPASPVDVYGRLLDEGYVIAIVDAGIGMSPEDLQVANARLRGEGAADAVPGRYLGHFVAGRLASNLGIVISLQKAQSGGLVARVKVPASLLEEPVPDLSAEASHHLSPAGAAGPTGSVAPAPAPAQPADVQPEPDGDELEAAEPETVGTVGATAPMSAGAPEAEPFAYLEPPAAEAQAAEVPAEDTWAEAAPAAATAEGARPAATATQQPPDHDLPRSWSDLAYTAVDFEREDQPAELPGEAGVGTEPEAITEPEEDTAQAARAEAGAEPAGAEQAVASPTSSSGPSGEGTLDWSKVWAISWGTPTPEMAGAAPASPLGATRPVGATQPLGSTQPVGAGPVAGPNGTLGAAGASRAGEDRPLVGLSSVPDLSAHGPSLAGASSMGPAGATSYRTSPEAPATSYRTPPEAPTATAPAGTGPSSLRPAVQAAATAAGLRKLTRRVPGASLADQDSSLRRPTPTTTTATANPMGLAGALSQYLSATTSESRSATTSQSRADKEQKD